MKGKKLVVFYSRTGNTKRIAKTISSLLNADLEEIIDKKKRSGIIGWLKSGKEGSKRSMTEIEEIKKDHSDYDMVIIGTPIWAGNLSSPIRTYISQNKNFLNKIAFFCTCDSDDGKKAFEEMENIIGKKPLATLTVSEKDLKTGHDREKINMFVRKI